MTEERIDAIQTRWSLIRDAHLRGRPEDVSQARQLLVMRYAPAIRRYVGAIVRNDDQADEISQDVLLRLMRGDFAGADPHRGRFRDLLKVAVRNMVRDVNGRARRRQTTTLIPELTVDDEDDRRDREWLRVWQKSVLDHTWNRMLAEDGGKPGTAWLALKLKADFPDRTSDQLAAQLSDRTGSAVQPDNFRQLLKRARRRFVTHLLDELRAGLDSETDERLQEELADLELLELVRQYS